MTDVSTGDLIAHGAPAIPAGWAYDVHPRRAGGATYVTLLDLRSRLLGAVGIPGALDSQPVEVLIDACGQVLASVRQREHEGYLEPTPTPPHWGICVDPLTIGAEPTGLRPAIEFYHPKGERPVGERAESPTATPSAAEQTRRVRSALEPPTGPAAGPDAAGGHDVTLLLVDLGAPSLPDGWKYTVKGVAFGRTTRTTVQIRDRSLFCNLGVVQDGHLPEVSDDEFVAAARRAFSTLRDDVAKGRIVLAARSVGIDPGTKLVKQRNRPRSR
jgi:hypothetical protein